MPYKLSRRLFPVIFTAVICCPLASLADEPISDADEAFFESRIRPVLVRHCYECHSLQAGSEAELRVDNPLSLRSGGSRGPAIVPGDPEASLLWQVVTHADAELQMPPDKPRLPPQVLADIRQWITAGAPDPRSADLTDGDRKTPPAVVDQHWAYQPVQSVVVPQVEEDRGWSRSAVDRFIYAQLSAAGLSPSADAEPHVLLRRLYFDLVGVPPAPLDVERFLVQCQSIGMDNALANQVDCLLATPAFGERWGRHWLDVARYGESSGKEANISFPYAWRYRDYVLDCFNDDVPFDRFLIEQIAGDLLPYENRAERSRLLVATGFLAVGTKNLSENDDRQFRADLVDEQIDTLTRATMASSVACARCHDHKFDPFSMEDYYALAGVFNSTETYFGTYVSPANNRGGHPLPLPRLDDQQLYHPSIPAKQLEKLQSQLVELQAEWAEMEAAKAARFVGKTPAKEFTLRDVLSNIWRRGPVAGKLETVDETGQAIPLAMGVLDASAIGGVPLLMRGEIERPGKIVHRALPQSISPNLAGEMPTHQSGRHELAAWLVHPKHPLTSRVMVNRVWRHLFGDGLVRTVDNFGTTGEPPSHPELLDYLAAELMQDGWSVKRLVRGLVLSRVYRQSTEYREDAFLVDPDNRWLWRMSKRRLEAEAIRDAMLSVSGELEFSRPGGSLVATQIQDRPISLIGLDKRLPADLDGARHRSVYLPVIRDRLPDILELFDFAEPSLVTGRRDETNVPLQALYLINSSFVQQRAIHLAGRLQRETHGNEDIVRRCFRLCFGRPPLPSELKIAVEFLEAEAPVAERGDQQFDNLCSFCQALLCTAEFRNLD